MYYVYEHWLDNQCFYVGSGTKGSKWSGKERYEQFQDNRRNEHWVKFVDGRYNDIKIVIVEEFNEIYNCRKFEKELSLKMKNMGHPITGKKDGDSAFGENNPHYGKKGMYAARFGKKHTSETKQILSKKLTGGNSPRAKNVLLVDGENNIIKVFNTVKDAYYGDWRYDYSKPHSHHYVRKCLKEGISFHGYYLKYEDDYLEELKNGENL